MDQQVERPIIFNRVILGELPFTLNLPEGAYPVLHDGAPYPIDLLQNRVAVADGPEMMVIGTPEDLKGGMGERWGAAFKHELRTLVRNRRQVELRRADLLVPSEHQLFEATQRYLMRINAPGSFGGSEPLQKAARAFLDRLSEDDRAKLTIDASVRLSADAHFPRTEVEQFCGAVNALIRLYMARFKDRFVQELTESMFSGTAMRGVRHSVFCNGQEMESVTHAGGYVPFIIRRQWWTHPEQDVNEFRSQLETAPTPDPVAMLHVRASSMLLRGAYRSAMLEASAAFDLCIIRKIHTGFASKGKTDPEIQTLLDAKERYEDRAKELLKQAIGKSVPEVDNTRWERFRKDRKNRGSIAHSANEPDAKYATEAVENMIALTEAIDRLPA